MKLRVVTATRGESPYWPATAESVQAAAPQAEHVVVCPAGKQVVVAGAHRSLRVVGQRAPGLYPAINQALREPGDWDAFTWINDDDVLRAPGFGHLVERMRRDHAVDVAYGRVDLIDGRGARMGALPIARTPADLAALFAQDIIPFAQPGTVIRRRLHERLGGIDERYQVVGDMDFFIRALAGGAAFAHVDAHVGSFRLHAGQLSKRREEVAAETARAMKGLAGIKPGAAARWRFRLANLGAYVERVRRHGFVSMRQLYDRTQ